MSQRPSKPPTLDELVRGVRQAAHDTSNWLAAALGHVTRLESGASSPEAKAALEGLRATLEASAQLQADLMDLASGEGRMPSPRARMDLATALAPVAAAFAARATSTVELQTYLAPGAEVFAAPDAVRNAVGNLLTNALAATERGHVDLGVRVDRSRALAILWVGDTGLGMDDETRQRCLEDGFSGRGSTGLGLAEVQRVAREHGAKLHIHSAPGQGTVVELQFPLITDRRVAADADVLVVDDDPHVAEMLQAFLSETDWTGDHVWDAEEALARFEAQPTPVVLLDFHLPDVDGVALAKRIRQLDPTVGIVLLTGQRTEFPGHSRTIDVVLRKPVELEQLHRSLVEARHRRDERLQARTAQNASA